MLRLPEQDQRRYSPDGRKDSTTEDVRKDAGEGETEEDDKLVGRSQRYLLGYHQ